jgi:hypothetical protein
MKTTPPPLPMAVHLTPEQLAAYVDGGLPQAERDGVEQHMAECRECLAQLAGVVRTISALKSARYLIAAVVLVALLASASWASAQSVVYTNIIDGKPYRQTIVRVERPAQPAVPVPPSIATTPVLPSNYRVPLGAGSYVPRTRSPWGDTRVSRAVKPEQPMFVNGIYVGPSPSGNWTSTSIGRPIVDVRIIDAKGSSRRR